MRYFTDSPFERMMMQIPRHRQEPQSKPALSKGHPCHGCKRFGENCSLPCYRGVTAIPPALAPERPR